MQELSPSERNGRIAELEEALDAHGECGCDLCIKRRDELEYLLGSKSGNSSS